MEEIEPRLLYSADPALLGVSLAGAQPVVEQRIVGQDGEFQGTAGVAESDGKTHELLVVGAGIEDSGTLLKGLAGDGRDIEVLVLDPDRDSISQISTALAGRQDLSAIHILSHGADGVLALGASTLDSAGLAARAGEIGRWGDALKPGGDILLYGCDVAADGAGQAFVRQFAALTGADVAASDNLTGSAGLHGDWTLEYATGGIETGIAFTAAAQQGWGGLLETLVNGNTADNQTQAAVAVGANGNTVVVWTADKAEDGDKHGIFGQLFDAHGNLIGSQFQVNTSSHDEQQNGAVGMAADGSFVVTWQSHTGDLGESGWGIRAQRFDAAGNRMGSEFVVNALTANEQTSPAIAVAADGQFVIAWASSVNNDVYVRHFDRLGNALSGDIQANPANIGATQSVPSVGIADDGSFLVAWQSDSGGTGKAVFAQRFTAIGTPNGLSFRVNTSDANDQTAPTVAMNGNGYAVIAWTSANQDGDKNGIYAQRYNPDGSAAGGEFRVNSVTVNDQSHPSAAIDGAGNVLIAWSSVGQDNGGSTGVYAQRYDAGGAMVGGAFLVNSTTAQNQQAPAVAMNPLGSAAIAWEGNGVGDTNGVFVANYVAANTPPSANADTASVSQGNVVASAVPGVLANDTDPDAGYTLTVAAVGTGAGGTPVAVPAGGITVSGAYGELTINPDGSYRYNANAAAAYALGAGQTASDVFTYVVKDNDSAASSATLTITISGTNDAPIAANDSYAVDKGGTLSVSAGGVLRNDSDPDTVPAPDTLTVTSVSVSGGAAGTVGQVLIGQYGSLTLNANGSFAYAPDTGNTAVSGLAPGQTLTDRFSYQVSDAAGALSQATISINIVGSDSAPVVNDDSYALQQGASLTVAAPGVLGNDTDQENNVLSAIVISGPSNGILRFNGDGSFVYTPNAAFYGVDSFTYRATDGSLNSARDATVSLTVTHVNHAPAAADDAVAVNQDATASAAAGGVLANDTDADVGDALSLTAIESGVNTVSVAAGGSGIISSDYGTVTIYGDGSYSYVANGLASRALGAGAMSSDSFVYTISDGKGGSASANLVFTVTGANDAPTIAGTQGSQAVNDNASISPFTSVSVGDIDNPTQTLSVTISLDNAAKGSLGNLGGGSYNAGTGVYSVSGSAAQVSAAINGLVFTPTANRVAPGSTETTGFTVSVSDGIATIADNSVSVVSASVNDAPTIAGTQASQSVDDNATLSPFTSLAIGDADNPAQVLTVTVALDAAARGSLSSIAGGSYDSSAGVYSVTGSAAQVSAALNALVFTPTANRVAPGSSETVALTLSVYDGFATTTDASTRITVTSVNDAPGITGAAPGQTVTDTGTLSPFASLAISDADSPAQTLAVTITLDAAAKGSLSNLGGGSYDSNTGVYTVSGTAAQVNGAINGLVFTPTANRVAPGSSETTRFTISVSDGSATATNSLTSVVSGSVNDAPSITGTLAGQAVNDNATLSPFASVVIADADNPAQTLTVTITLDTAAKGGLANLGGGSYNAASGVYTVSGAAAQVSAALNALIFTPSANRVAPGGAESTTFTLAVSDGMTTASDATTSVIVTSVNDAPTVAGTRAGQAVNDDASLSPFAGVSVGDADLPAQTLSVTIALDDPAKGSLGNLGGGSYNGSTGVYSISGSGAQVNAAINGLTFTPIANRVAPGSSETTRFTISASDGVATTTDAVTSVASYSINDVPTIGGAQAGQAVNDNASLSPFAALALADADKPAQTLTVTVTLDDAAKGGLTQLGGGSYDMAAGVYRISGNAAAVSAALRGLVFTPTEGRVTPGLAETTTFAVSVSDGASAANAAASVVSTAIDHAPVALALAAATTVDTGALLPLRLLATDADRDSLSFTITSLPAHGSLYADAAGTRPIAVGAVLPGQGDGVTVYYRPDALWAGSTRFSYIASDPHGMASAAATVSLDVSAPLAAAKASMPAAPATATNAASDGAVASGAADAGTAASAEGRVAAKLLSVKAASAPAAVPGFGEMAAPAEAAAQQPAAPVPTASSSAARAETRSVSYALAVPALTGAAGVGAASAASAESGQQQPGADALASARSGSGRGGEEIMRALEPLRESLKQSDAAGHRVVAASMAVGTGFSVGYVIWLVRGGVLATSLMSSLPVWRFVDPLPVLKTVKQAGDNDDDDSLEDMVRAEDDAGDADRMKS